jgi:hypothetical protein
MSLPGGRRAVRAGQPSAAAGWAVLAPPTSPHRSLRRPTCLEQETQRPLLRGTRRARRARSLPISRGGGCGSGRRLGRSWSGSRPRLRGEAAPMRSTTLKLAHISGWWALRSPSRAAAHHVAERIGGIADPRGGPARRERRLAAARRGSGQDLRRRGQAIPTHDLLSPSSVAAGEPLGRVPGHVPRADAHVEADVDLCMVEVTALTMVPRGETIASMSTTRGHP